MTVIEIMLFAGMSFLIGGAACGAIGNQFIYRDHPRAHDAWHTVSDCMLFVGLFSYPAIFIALLVRLFV